MAKLSVSVPDEIVAELRAEAADNLSAFVSNAIRHELDRRRLAGFLDELDEELGPPDEAEVARYQALFDDSARARRAPRRRRPPSKR